MASMTLEQWNAYIAQGYTADQLKAAGYTLAAPTTPGPMPAPQLPPAQAVTQSARGTGAGLNLGDAGFGNQEGRIPEGDGVHLVKLVRCYDKNTNFGGRFIVEYVMLESTSAEVEINGDYSKGYDLTVGTNAGKMGRNDTKGWIADVVDALHPEWQIRTQDPTMSRAGQFLCTDPCPAEGMLFVLRTETRKAKTTDREWTKHEWKIVPAGSTLASLGRTPARAVSQAPAAPIASALPPLPPPSGPAVGGLPPLPGLPSSTRPAGYQGEWPPKVGA